MAWHEVAAALGVGEELVAQDALVDLDSRPCRPAAARPRRRPRRLVGTRPGTSVGGVVGQPLDAHELAPAVGQPVVERAGMAAQEGEAGVARGLLEGLGRVMGRGVALGLGGQAGELLLGVRQ